MYKRQGYGKPQHSTIPGVVRSANPIDARVAKLEELPALVMKLAQELQRYKKEAAMEIAQLKEKLPQGASTAGSTGSEVLVDLHEGDLPDLQRAISSLAHEMSPQPADTDTPRERTAAAAAADSEESHDVDQQKEEDPAFKSPFAAVDKKKKKKKKKEDKTKKRDSESDAD
jgi:hypothetical protein